MDRKNRMIWVAIGLAVCALVLVPVLDILAGETATAEGEGEEEKAGVSKDSLWDLVIIGGGPVGWLIILLSVVSLALIIEHFFSIRRETLCPPEIIGTVEALFEEQDYEEALTVVETDPSYLAKILEAILAKVPDITAMETAMLSAQEEQNTKLKHKISYLALLGNVSPMLGLFGTVQGMMMAFSVIKNQPGVPKPQDLARGIETALVTTFLGLMVGIPALTAFAFFRNKIEASIIEVNGITTELIEGFKSGGGGGGAEEEE